MTFHINDFVCRFLNLVYRENCFTMFRKASITRFDSVVTTGRNSPLRVVAETPDEVEHEVFLKVSGSPELGVEGLANELLAAGMAGDLGLPITEPFLVELDPSWISIVPDATARQILQRSNLVAFGSKAAGPQWRIWGPGDKLRLNTEKTALEILVFDAFIENDDRKNPNNPNCLTKGEEFRIIDHETAFRFRQKLFPRPQPWVVGNLERFVAQDGHIFGAKLKGRPIDTQPVREAWSKISEERFEEYLGGMPDEWAEAMDAMNDAREHFRMIRERLDDCFTEVERALS